MSLVTTVSYKYQVNGFTSRKVVPKRGLRHGDPLSSYLLTLVFDVLSRLIIDACNNNAFMALN